MSVEVKLATVDGGVRGFARQQLEPATYACGCSACASGNDVPASGAPAAGGAVGAIGSVASGDAWIDGLLSGVQWSADGITYSSPGQAGDFEPSHPEMLTDYRPVNAAQLRAIDATLAVEMLSQSAAHRGFSVAGFTDLEIGREVRNPGDATLRLANTSDPGTAYAYYPNSSGYGGDVFFGPSGRNPFVGNYDYYTLIHEIGHALGLKHGHETGRFGSLPFAQDSMEFSVMTYRSFVGSDARFVYNENFGYAQTFMMFDIAALQHLYGADYETRSDDTVYLWTPKDGRTQIDGDVALAPGENRIFVTVWDGGGTDTYDLSAYDAAVDVDLTPGGFSTFSDAQRAYLGGGPDDGFARGNVFNALQFEGDPRSLIENAIGGAGDDILRGNAAQNLLVGDDGDDSLFGDFGKDSLRGGAGDDRLEGGGDTDLLDGGTGNDTAIYSSLNTSVLVDLNAGKVSYPDRKWGSETLISIENVVTGSGRDTLIGSKVSNRLDARSGDDRLEGGQGADLLIGGSGADMFVFRSVSDSTPGAPDRLIAGDAARAFEGAGVTFGDRIDLLAIDAISGRPDTAFEWGGVALKSKGYVWLAASGDETRVRANTDGDPAAEFELAILDGSVNHTAYTAADFIL